MRGYYIRARVPRDPSKIRDLALDATLRASAIRRTWEAIRQQRNDRRPLITSQDLREKVRVGWGNRLVVFLVDSSDSMDASQQLAAAKGAVFLLLSSAYVRRDRVSLVAFQGERAQVILPPTASIHLARKKLAYLSPGGATPLADGLYTSWKLLRAERIKNPKRRIVLVILSDGEGNVPLIPGGDQERELTALAELIRKEKIHVVLVDTNPEGKASEHPKKLATTLGAELKKLKRMASFELVRLVEKG
ncbi:MAG: VWA domain-containing protein [Spirochaetes bacterium]|nr:VWA domain-containing protein [Spirochaetota bacterium]